MRFSKTLWTIGGLTVLALVLPSLLPVRHRESATYSGTFASRSQEPAAATTPPSANAKTVGLRQGASRSANAIDYDRSSGQKLIHLRNGEVLARVNDKVIQLCDIVPVTAQDAVQSMRSDEYDSRLNRAIEMELTYQAAAAQRVELNADQTHRLVRIAENPAADFRALERQGMSWSSITHAQVEFEKRVITALMLQQNLVAKEESAAPSADAARQAAYEAARQAMLSRLKANSAIVTIASVPQ